MESKNKKSYIDWYIVCAVREMRNLKDISQEDIALHLNLSTGFIGHIESPNFRAKYNTQHLNELAKLFGCSPRDFLPEIPFD
jgi:transcriptional regulator with XRE-family HTH domain